MTNIWEDQKLGGLYNFHEQVLQKMGIPKWMNLNCPFCNKEQPLRSITEVSVKFNTRNCGDLVVEVLCDSCNKMVSMYFRQEIATLLDLIPLLKGEKEPKSKPITEPDMYKMRYNNIADKKYLLEGGEKNGNNKA